MRIRGLDFLRGVAIIGVLFRHLETDTWLSGPGGFGVDLFFVLSGFLVSGLLFVEYKRNHRAGIGRFLIRRGFKIYPSFYFFIAATLLFFGLRYGSWFPAHTILSEIFFLQSYLKPMWSHTWSLAIEEHFYFLLAFIIFVAIRFRFLEKHHWMIGIFLFAILLSMTLRLIYCFTDYRLDPEPFYATHLRIDGLFTGALLGYCWHFKQEWINRMLRHRKTLGLLVLLFVSPAFILPPGHLFMVSVGFNFLHLAFLFAVILSADRTSDKILFGNQITAAVSIIVCRIGIYSYSIYLWHLPVQNFLLRTIETPWLESIFYMIVSIAFGIVASVVIERPMLKIRDYYFPRGQKGLTK